jgi:cell division protein FtsW
MKAIRGAGVQALLIALILVGLGLVMVYSASSVLASVKFADSSFFLERQSIRAAIGIVLMFLFVRIPLDLWARGARLMLVFGFVLLVLVLLLGEGRNTQRWFWLAGVAFQPSEYVKLVLVVYLADVMARREEQMNDFRSGLLPRLLVIAAVVLLVALQPDLGTALAIGMIAGVMLWVGGARPVHLLGCGLAMVPFVAFSLYLAPYQLRRFLNFIQAGDVLGNNYQLEQSLLALGSGGFYGVGLGNSMQKQQFLPEPHTDFVFAFIGEEMGLVGTLIVIGLFVAFAIHGLRIAREAPTYHGFLLATGITAMISVYAMLNIGVVTGVLPTTGLPLPFISYGGSALLWNLSGVGILVGIARPRVRGEQLVTPRHKRSVEMVRKVR